MIGKDAINILKGIQRENLEENDFLGKCAIDMAIEALKETERNPTITSWYDFDRGYEKGKAARPLGKEEIALNVACDLLIGSCLYGYDFDRIFEELMERDGVVSSLSIKEFIFDNIQELGKEYFTEEGEADE